MNTKITVSATRFFIPSKKRIWLGENFSILSIVFKSLVHIQVTNLVDLPINNPGNIKMEI